MGRIFEMSSAGVACSKKRHLVLNLDLKEANFLEKSRY